MKYELELKPGDIGVDDTVYFMILFANKYANLNEIRNELIDNNLLESDKDKRIHKIYNYFVSKYKYVPDPEGIELVRSPKWTILNNERYGDCDDLSTALATYLLTAGIRVKFRVGAWKKEYGNNFTHVWVLAKGTNWIPLDPSAGINGYNKEVNWFRKKDYSV